MCDAYDYADDNRVGCSGNGENEVNNKYLLDYVSSLMLKCFKSTVIPSFNTVKYGSNYFTNQGSNMWDNLPSYC